MNSDFHYYATYSAACLAGFAHEECLDIAYSSQLVDLCSKTFLAKIKGPREAATTQLQLELMDARTDPLGIHDITRIWASFHFLPHDLYANPGKRSKHYLDKYRLICGTNSDLLVSTVELAHGESLQAAGLAMHVLADTWAHRYFAGTPSLVINNTSSHFYELLENSGERRIKFSHNPKALDDLENGIYVNSLYQSNESSIMNLGHGRAGHLPDYSFARYRFLPAWGGYSEIVKDNPAEYMNAFCQMVYALRYLRGDYKSFEKYCYDTECVAPYRGCIAAILSKRQTDSSADWKAFGEELSGRAIPDFDLGRYEDEYRKAADEEKDETFLGRFILAALAQKSMVTNKIFSSGNLLAGYSVDFAKEGFAGIRDYAQLVEHMAERRGLTLPGKRAGANE